MDEDALLAKLIDVETSLTDDGRRLTTAEYRRRLQEWREREPDIEYRCSIPSTVSQRVFVGMCLRYGLVPYMRSRGKSLCVRAPDGFVREVLWPEFDVLTRVVEDALCDVAERVVESWTGESLGRRQQKLDLR